MLEASLNVHVGSLGLEVVAYSSGHGLWVAPQASADHRTVQAARRARRAQHFMAVPMPERAVDLDTAFRIDDDSGAHAARVAARVQALAATDTRRLDYEGLQNVDVEAMSCSVWREWKDSLTAEQRSLLAVWRGGAVKTPTRFFEGWRARAQGLQACRHCPCPRASARHLWAECPRLETHRRCLAREYGLPPNWWLQQPRCTAKSGWVTFAAGSTCQRRALGAIAACRLGIQVVLEGAAMTVAAVDGGAAGAVPESAG